MEKIIYNGQDITDNIMRKEKAVIKLYAKQKRTSYRVAARTYYRSKLYYVIRDVENGLWAQSEYYIMERYSNLISTSKSESRYSHVSPSSWIMPILPMPEVEAEKDYKKPINNIGEIREVMTPRSVSYESDKIGRVRIQVRNKG